MTDCLVIGGGIIGMLTARELARDGLTVTILEQAKTGQESSWAGGGILSPLYPWRYDPAVTALAKWSQARYEAVAQELLATSGIDPEWICNGMMILDSGEEQEALPWAQQNNMVMERLDSAAAHHIEPQLGTVNDNALWMPEIAQMRNPRLVRALRGDVLAQGIKLEEQVEAQSFVVEAGRICGVNTNKGRFDAPYVVVAGGAWSGSLMTGLGLALEVEPVLGQMIVFRAPIGLVSRIVLSRERYVIPRKDGHVVVGSTLERRGFEKTTTEAALQELRAEALRIIPALAEYEVERQWAGLRPGSPEGIPYVGEHPEISGLYVNAGHFRNGVVIGLASARLMADLITGQNPILDPAPYALPLAKGK